MLQILNRNSDGSATLPPFNVTGRAVKPFNRLVEQAQVPTQVDWHTQFVTIGQLEAGGVKMLVEGFLPEGITMLGALSGVGKTWLGLSLAKPLTPGSPFLG